MGFQRYETESEEEEPDMAANRVDEAAEMWANRGPGVQPLPPSQRARVEANQHPGDPPDEPGQEKSQKATTAEEFNIQGSDDDMGFTQVNRGENRRAKREPQSVVANGRRAKMERSKEYGKARTSDTEMVLVEA